MDRKEMEAEIIELRIERETERRVKLRCIAFWSTTLTVTAAIGAWCSSHIRPVKAAAQAFWDNL
jgi:hypothetical protein